MSTSKSVNGGTIDPHKRLNYVEGMVLGVSELQQEQFHFMHRDRVHQRGLHGYGTANGLGVTINTDDPANPEVVVSPGLAIDPKGRTICVPSAQCAKLNDWLAKQDPESPTSYSPLYVYACYRECETDEVAIPSGPCKDDTDTLKASRLAETFKIEFRREGPDQQEELFASLLGRLLERIEVDEAVGSGDVLSLEEFFSTPWKDLETDLEITSPPLRIRVHPDQLEPSLRRVLTWWITEVRPWVLGDGCAGNPSEDCVLLARLEFATDESDPPRVSGEVTVHNEERPFLLSTRVLQEWARLGTFAFESDKTLEGEAAGGDLTGLYPNPRVKGLRGHDLPEVELAETEEDQKDQYLIWNGSEWVFGAPETLSGETAARDVTGTFPDQLVVAGIHDSAVPPPGPAQANQFLGWDGSQWVFARPRNMYGESADRDVQGTFPDELIVKGICDRKIVSDGGDPSSFEDNSVIVWKADEDAWRVERISTDGGNQSADGDATGPLNNLEVVAIREVPVAPEASEPRDGDLLVYSAERKQWQLGSLGPQVVAAGYFNKEGREIRSVGAVFGDLSASVIDDSDLDTGGLILLKFGEYSPAPKDDPGSHMYIVKGHPVDTSIGSVGYFRPMHVDDNQAVLGPFREDGIVVKVVASTQGKEFNGDFMVEVTRIEGTERGGSQ